MRWVEGLTLAEFVEEHLERPGNLKMLLDLWVKLAARLREAEMAHADLQHGNVLLVPMSGGSLALRLIDYDGMYVPALAGTRSGEVGHPAYQHPQRLREGTYNAEVDRFSHLAIYCGIRCLMLGRRRVVAAVQQRRQPAVPRGGLPQSGRVQIVSCLMEESAGRGRSGIAWPSGLGVRNAAGRGAAAGRGCRGWKEFFR